jgi:hypothetical protein
MPAEAAVARRRCSACGGPVDFLPTFPFITALTMLMLDVGPAEIRPDGSGSWVCRNPSCGSRTRRAVVVATPPPDIRRRPANARYRLPSTRHPARMA